MQGRRELRLPLRTVCIHLGRGPGPVTSGGRGIDHGPGGPLPSTTMANRKVASKQETLLSLFCRPEVQDQSAGLYSPGGSGAGPALYCAPCLCCLLTIPGSWSGIPMASFLCLCPSLSPLRRTVAMRSAPLPAQHSHLVKVTITITRDYELSTPSWGHNFACCRSPCCLCLGHIGGRCLQQPSSQV